MYIILLFVQQRITYLLTYHIIASRRHYDSRPITVVSAGFPVASAAMSLTDFYRNVPVSQAAVLHILCAM